MNTLNNSFTFNKIMVRLSKRVSVLSKAYHPETAMIGSIA